MADVTGTLGDQPIQLNNAATEITLRALLDAVRGTGTATQNSIRALAKGSNLDPDLINKQNLQTSLLTEVSGSLGKTFNQVGMAAGFTAAILTTAAQGLRNLANNTGQPSDLFGTMSQMLPGIFGSAAQLGQQILKISESWLATYRTISDTGVNFNGSLSEMRLAASNMLMPLEKFAQVVQNNSRALASMGPTANEGTRAWVNATQALVKSDAGSRLMALGYKAEDLGEHMLSYITMTGGRTQQEMKNTSALTKSTEAYLSNLDALAQITGVSRKQQEDEMKKIALNAAFQRKMQTLDTEERNKMMSALAAATATGIEGAGEAVMTEFLGFPPILESARNLAGFLPEVFQEIRTLVGTATDASSGMEDVRRQGASLFSSAIDGVKKFGQAGDALILGGNKTITTAQMLANQAATKGLRDTDSFVNAIRQAETNQRTTQASEAAKAAQAEKAVREAMNAAMQALVPLISSMSSTLQTFIIKFADSIRMLAQTPKVLEGLWTATKVLTAAFLIYRATMLGAAIGGGIGEILENRRRLPTPGGPGGGTPGEGRPGPTPPSPGPTGGGRFGWLGKLLPWLVGGGVLAGTALYSPTAGATEDDMKKMENRRKEIEAKPEARRSAEEREELEEIKQAKAFAEFGMTEEDKMRLRAAEAVYKSMPPYDPAKAEQDKAAEENRHSELIRQLKSQNEHLDKAVTALRNLNPDLFK